MFNGKNDEGTAGGAAFAGAADDFCFAIVWLLLHVWHRILARMNSNEPSR
jgi:hypothetical protein